MAISRLYIDNFKGIGEGQWIDIKPITVFIGANSSGKSSCIHALACLSQTLKVPNNLTPLVIDDEFANVHLGRFIDVIHSKSYQNTISLGLTTSSFKYIGFDEQKKATKKSSIVEVIYDFKCSQRTQDIRIEAAKIKIGDIEYTYKWSSSGYVAINNKTSSKLDFKLGSGFLLSPESIFNNVAKENLNDFFPLLKSQNALSSELSNTYYLGPFRESPRRKGTSKYRHP